MYRLEDKDVEFGPGIHAKVADQLFKQAHDLYLFESYYIASEACYDFYGPVGATHKIFSNKISCDLARV